jgi:hypothetical protein
LANVYHGYPKRQFNAALSSGSLALLSSVRDALTGNAPIVGVERFDGHNRRLRAFAENIDRQLGGTSYGMLLLRGTHTFPGNSDVYTRHRFIPSSEIWYPVRPTRWVPAG